MVYKSTPPSTDSPIYQSANQSMQHSIDLSKLVCINVYSEQTNQIPQI